MNIYVDKHGHRGSSRDNERIRFPVAQYGRRQLRMFSWIYHLLYFFLKLWPVRSSISCQECPYLLIDTPNKRSFFRQQDVSIIENLQDCLQHISALVYIIPPLINFYGKMFSVAELIASGYASLVSSGVPPAGSFNMMPFFQPVPRQFLLFFTVLIIFFLLYISNW